MVFLLFLGRDWELAAGAPSLKRSEPVIGSLSSGVVEIADQELPQGVVQALRNTVQEKGGCKARMKLTN
jgi:hypothetical protein